MTALAPLLADLPPHALAAFTADVDAALAELRLAAADVIDLGLGESVDPVAPHIRQALIDAVGEGTRYPPTAGLPELREAIARWCERRFGARLDPDRAIQPTQGSKEAIFSLAAALRAPGRELVAVTTPGYAVPERGARVAGCRPLELPLDPARGLLPELDRLDDGTWDRLSIFWLNYPNNPTGAVAPPGLFAELAERARRHGFVLASDEAYTELWFDGDPPASALELRELDNVLVFHSLSKRSGLTGYRTGFVAGDPGLIATVRKFRAMAGAAPTEFVQRAAIAAWEDEEHVAERRRSLGRKRAVVLGAVRRAGLPVLGSRAGMFLWVAAPGGDADGFARALLRRGVVVVPGRYFGAGGDGFVRIAPVVELARCEDAARRIEEVAAEWTG